MDDDADIKTIKLLTCSMFQALFEMYYIFYTKLTTSLK